MNVVNKYTFIITEHHSDTRHHMYIYRERFVYILWRDYDRPTDGRTDARMRTHTLHSSNPPHLYLHTTVSPSHTTNTITCYLLLACTQTHTCSISTQTTHTHSVTHSPELSRLGFIVWSISSRHPVFVLMTITWNTYNRVSHRYLHTYADNTWGNFLSNVANNRQPAETQGPRPI